MICLALTIGLATARATMVATNGPASFASDDAFLDYVERQTFNFFWNDANTNTGLIQGRDSITTYSHIAALGFGLSAINVAMDRGYITRSQGAARELAILQTLYNTPQGTATTGTSGNNGLFYFDLNMTNGLRWRTVNVATMDNGHLFMGVIDAGEYFKNPTTATESNICLLSSNLLARMNWQSIMRPSDGLVYAVWAPETGYSSGIIGGYNESMNIYIIGLGAPNNPLPTNSWTSWCSSYNWATLCGQSHVVSGTMTMFIDQYSHMCVDFRQIADAYMRGKGIDYFENSRRAALVQQQYAIQNPLGFPNYSATEWGLTSCDGPGTYPGPIIVGGKPYWSYLGRGAYADDDGTIAPTAVGGSMPFAPEICLPALKQMYFTYTNKLWTTMGFRDAYNIQYPPSGWFDNGAGSPDAIGIDQGPIVLMIENYRSGSIWTRVLGSAIIQRGLQRAGFTAPPPDQLTAAVVSPTQINLSWRTNSNYQTGYQVESSVDGVNFSPALVGAGSTNMLLAATPGITNYYRARTTSANGISGYRQIIATLTSPMVAVTSPATGSGFTAPATIPLAASVSSNGSPVVKVQFYSGQTTLIGESLTYPYTYNWSGVNAGSYSVTAVVVYNTTDTLASSPVNLYVTAAGAPSAPATLTATPVSTSQINLSWQPSAGATSYLISRNGAMIGTSATTNFSNSSLAAGTPYTYLVFATNATGLSVPTQPVTATTLLTGGTLAWVPNPAVNQAQDGGGIWVHGPPGWLAGTNVIGWIDGNTAVIGLNTVNNYVLSLADNISPSGITFNNTNLSGSYTIAAGGGAIAITNPATFTVNAGVAYVNAPLTGSAPLTNAGTGILTLGGSNTYSGVVNISAGTLALSGASPLAASAQVIINPAGTLELAGGILSAPVVVTNGTCNLKWTYPYGSNVINSPITIQNGKTLVIDSVKGSSDFSSLYIRGGITSATGNLTIYDDYSGSQNAWIQNTPLNLPGGSLSGFGFHVAVAGNLVKNLQPVWGRVSFLEVDNAFSNAPALILGGSNNNGKFDLNGHSLMVSSITNYGGIATPDEVTCASGVATLTVSNAAANYFDGLFSGAGLSLAKSGAGQLTISNAQTYAGNTIVNGGTLALLAPAPAASVLSNSSALVLSNSAALDVSGVAAGFVLGGGQSLQGSGAVNGNITFASNASLMPGNSVAGSLVFSNNLILQSGSKTVLNVFHSPLTNDHFSVLGTFTKAGTLTITNSGTALAAGDAFQIFSAAGSLGGYASTNLPVLTPGLAWNTSGLATGALSVISIAPVFLAPLLGSNQITFAGTSGYANSNYYVLMTTNLSLPVTNWSRLLTNKFDSGGAFTFTATNAVRQRFYLIQVP